MEGLKGFIEVTDNNGFVWLINVNNISMIGRRLYFMSGDSPLSTKENYEEIKQLIKNAQ